MRFFFIFALCLRAHLFANFHKIGRKCIRAYQTKDYGLYTNKNYCTQTHALCAFIILKALMAKANIYS